MMTFFQLHLSFNTSFSKGTFHQFSRYNDTPFLEKAERTLKIIIL